MTITIVDIYWRNPQLLQINLLCVRDSMLDNKNIVDECKTRCTPEHHESGMGKEIRMLAMRCQP